MGRYEQRYYDGAEWTDRAASGGVELNDPIEPVSAAVDEELVADETVMMGSSTLGDLVGGAQTVAPAAAGAVAQPAAVAPGAGDTKSLSGFLDSIGNPARMRETPELPLALGGVGGGLVGLGVLGLVIGESQSRGAIIGASILILVLAFAAALKVLGQQPWLRTAATACCSVGLFGLVGGLILAGENVGSSEFGLFLLLTGALHLAAWVAPGFRGRPLMLGGGLVATSFGLATLVAGGSDCDDPFGRGFEECNFAEEAAGQIGLSTGAGIVMLLIGAALLFAVRKLDQMDYRGTAETVAAAAIITLIFGAIALSVDLGSTGNSLVVIAVGLGLGIVGHMAARRALTWTGAALVAGGVISLITNLIEPDDTRVAALVVVVIGASLIGVPRFIQMQAAQKAAAG